MRTDEQLVFVLLGGLSSPGPASLRTWWRGTEEWAAALGIELDRIAGWFGRKPNRMSSEGTYSLRRYRKRFESELSAGNLDQLTLKAASPGAKYVALDWLFSSNYGRRGQPGPEGIFDVGIQVPRLHESGGVPPVGFVQTALRRARAFIHGVYGFAVTMPRCFMPSGYILGLATVRMPENLRKDANACIRYDSGRACGSDVYCDRVIRNVYGWNVLNRKHLDIAVGRQRLSEWVSGADWRGRITDIGDGLFLWSFDEAGDDEQFLRWDHPPVMRVREALQEYGIFPWQRRAGGSCNPPSTPGSRCEV